MFRQEGDPGDIRGDVLLLQFVAQIRVKKVIVLRKSTKTAEFLDDVERRARSDKRARSRQLRDQRIPAESERTDERVAEPTPIMLRDWATPVDVDDIDWNSSDYDIVTIKDIRS